MAMVGTRCGEDLKNDRNNTKNATSVLLYEFFVPLNYFESTFLLLFVAGRGQL